MTNAHATIITPADKVKWDRLILAPNLGRRFVHQSGKYPVPYEWVIPRLRSTIELLPANGVAIIDVSHLTISRLRDVMREQMQIHNLRDKLGHRVGRIVLHNAYTGSHDETRPETYMLSHYGSTLHVLTKDYFESSVSDHSLMPDVAGWNFACQLLAGFNPKLKDWTITNFAAVANDALICNFGEIVWVENRYNMMQPYYEPRFYGFETLNIKEEVS